MTALPSRPKAAGPMSEPFDPYRKWLGIPPKDQPPHHYRLLGIATFEEDPDVIENAATRQMRHVRTFQTSKQHGPISQRILTELSAAKVCLLTPEHKAVYDQKLRARLAAAGQLSSTDLATAVVEPAEEVPEPEMPPLVTGNDLRWRTGDAGSRAGEPVPVPIPMPPVASGVAVAAPAFPGIRRSTVSMVRPYRRNSSLPIVLIVGSLLALAALAGVAFVIINGQMDESTAKHPKSKPAVNSDKSATKTAATQAKPVGAQVAASNKPAPFPVGISDSSAVSGTGSAPFTLPPSVPLVESTNSKPGSSTDRNELVDQMRQAVFRCEEALKNRQDDEFRQHFTRAEQLAANNDLPEQARFQEQVDDLRVLKQLNDEFWMAVRENLSTKVQPGEPIEFHQHKFELLSRDGEQVEYLLNGQKLSGEVRQLEPKAALLIASKTVQWEDPVTFLPIAAFLSVDGKVTDDNERKFGKQLFAIGRLIGKANPALARKYGLKDLNEEIKLDEDLAGKVPAPK